MEDLDSFVYLGANITWNSNSSENITKRMQLATGVYDALKVIWK